MLKKWFEQRKPIMILLGVVFIILALFIVPCTISEKIDRVSEIEGASSGDDIVYDLSKYDKSTVKMVISSISRIVNIGENFGNCFKYFGDYVSSIVNLCKYYLIAGLFLLIFFKPDKEYEKIEHGSAEWATPGEAYNVLSKSEGFDGTFPATITNRSSLHLL